MPCTLVVIDIASQYHALRTGGQGQKLKYDVYLNSIPFDNCRTYMYGTQIRDEAARFIERLKGWGAIVQFNRAEHLSGVANIQGTDRNIPIAVNVLRHVFSGLADRVVFGTNDIRILPIIGEARSRGALTYIYTPRPPEELLKACDYTLPVPEEAIQRGTTEES